MKFVPQRDQIHDIPIVESFFYEGVLLHSGRVDVSRNRKTGKTRKNFVRKVGYISHSA